MYKWIYGLMACETIDNYNIIVTTLQRHNVTVIMV